MDENSLNDELAKAFEAAHWFTFDLQHWAVINLNISLNGIDQEQKDFEANIRETETDEEALRSIISSSGTFYDDLRLNAYRMAAVALVTRFQNRIGELMRIGRLVASKKRENSSMLILQLKTLNKSLSDGPVPLNFFAELEEVRNSVVHGGSRAEWEFPQGKTRKVADAYRNPYGDVELSDDQLKDAMNKMIEQVKWYERRIAKQG